MDTILETGQPVESVRQSYDGKAERPDPLWVRGKCPDCNDDLVSNCYYVGGQKYLIVWECWASLATEPTCTYRKIL